VFHPVRNSSNAGFLVPGAHPIDCPAPRDRSIRYMPNEHLESIVQFMTRDLQLLGE
jgi:hypothetical protein